MKRPSTWESVRATAVEYSQISTTHGVYYIFDSKLGSLSRFMWTLMCTALLSIAIILILDAHKTWKSNPVITSVKTTGLPVSMLDYPAVTICGLGMIETPLYESLQRQIQTFINEHGNNDLELELLGGQEDFFHWAEVLLESYGMNLQMFLDEFYPGIQADEDLYNMFSILAAPDPDAYIFASVSAIGTQYVKDCHEATGNDTVTIEQCPAGSWHDSESEVCYIPRGKGPYVEEICSLDNVEWILEIYESSQTDYLLNYLSSDGGSLQAMKDGAWFWISGTRDDESLNFYFNNNIEIDIDNVQKFDERITLEGDFQNLAYNCLKMKYDDRKLKFRLAPANCEQEVLEIICMTGEERMCEEDEQVVNKMDFLLNPAIQAEATNDLAEVRRHFKKSFLSLDMQISYKNIFENLWHSQLPCYDSIHGNKSRSLLKKCFWKGQAMSCASIFESFPTDRGMCCTFNMLKAEEVFVKSDYQEMISIMQQQDRNFSKYSTKPKSSFLEGDEPLPQAGVNKGLTVILDAHSDQLAPGSVREDFEGFIAIIGSHDHYPLSELRNVRIRPGFENLVGITASNVYGSENLQKAISPEDRGCYFHDEFELMHHNRYSQASCFLECQMEYAKNMTTYRNKDFCTPWFLPKSDDENDKMCDPWRAEKYVQMMQNVPDQMCDYCLPDCNVTLYHTTVTAVPFRTCNEMNLGVSYLCSLNNKRELPDPPIFGHSVIQEYLNNPFLNRVPEYVKTSDSIRENNPSTATIFTHLGGKEYSAYERDIASVKIYFATPTVFQYSRDEAMTWVGFMSQMGGLLGLCLGISICSGVELIYWFTIRFWSNVSQGQKGKRNKLFTVSNEVL